MKRILLVLVSMILPCTAIADVKVGNGGDIVKCEGSSENNLQGLYSLDYVLSYLSNEQNKHIIPILSWDESRDRIKALVAEKIPMLSSSLEDFLNRLDNHFDYSQKRVWRSASHGLVDLKDEKMLRILPNNCKLDQDNPQLIQAVIRERKPGIVIYNYDDKILEQLKNERPIQYSFLMIHEWLWDFTQDVEVIREINPLIHSVYWQDEIPKNILLSLKRLGLISANDFYDYQEKLDYNLLRSTFNEDFNKVNELMKFGANPDREFNYSYRGVLCKTKENAADPLCQTIDQYFQVQEVVKNGRNFNSVVVAATRKNIEILRYLMTNSIHPVQVNNVLGSYAVEESLLIKNISNASLLVTHGASWDQESSFSREQIITRQINHGSIEDVQGLIAFGLKLENPKLPFTVIASDRSEMIRLFMDNGVAFTSNFQAYNYYIFRSDKRNFWDNWDKYETETFDPILFAIVNLRIKSLQFLLENNLVNLNKLYKVTIKKMHYTDYYPDKITEYHYSLRSIVEKAMSSNNENMGDYSRDEYKKILKLLKQYGAEYIEIKI